MKSRIVYAMAIAITATVMPLAARASLGGDLLSVQDDQAKLQGSVQTTSKDSYSIQEIQTPNGIAVREYVSPAGTVFAVAWQGRSHPDLHQVLGAYYTQYVQAVQAQRVQRHGHGPLLIQQPGLIVQMSGHMRSLTGRAYLPTGMPAGVRAEEIR
jgi:hypothetical protein